MTEDQLKTAIIQLAELNGWMVYSIRRSDQARVQGHTGKGFPDLVLLHPERRFMLVVELKAQAGKTTPPQERWLAALTNVKMMTAGLWRPEHWLSGEIEEVLRYRPPPVVASSGENREPDGEGREEVADGAGEAASGPA